MDPAKQFLQEIAQADARDEFLLPFADNVDGFEAAIESDPGAVETFIREASARGTGSVVDLNITAFASAAASATGKIVHADARFSEWLRAEDLKERLVGGTLDGKPQVMVIASKDNGRPVAVAAATAALARQWPLDPGVAALLASGAASHAVIAFTPDRDAWGSVARAFDLAPAEIRLLAALSRCGELKLAAKECRVTYETARKQVASMMRKTGSSRQTELVRQALRIAAGSVGPLPNADGIFAELFDLTLRQARLAREVAAGETRGSAATKAMMSPTRAKADLKAVYIACNVTTAVDLARIVAEVDALAGLADACDVAIGIKGAHAEPLRLLRRADRSGRIAFADHGPAGARPVLVFHTTTGGRAISPRLLKALGAANFRAIAIERPGYGLSDIVDGHIWDSAARDVTEVLDALEIERALILGRGGAQPAVATAAKLGVRIVAGVLLAPDPPVHLDRSRSGMMGRSKTMIYSSPVMLTALATLLSRRTSSIAIEKMMRASVKACGIDMAVCNDPDELASLVKGGRQSARGMMGFVREHEALSRGDVLPRTSASVPWSILFGDQDPLFNASDARAWWLDQLPGCEYRLIQGGGRFLHATHTADIIKTLDRLANIMRI